MKKTKFIMIGPGRHFVVIFLQLSCRSIPVYLFSNSNCPSKRFKQEHWEALLQTVGGEMGYLKC